MTIPVEVKREGGTVTNNRDETKQDVNRVANKAGRGFTGTPGDPSKAPRCLAKTRRGTLCQCPAMKNPRSGRQVRCYRHGGSSTGAKSEAGLARIVAAKLKHGRRSKAFLEAKRAARERIAALRQKAKDLQ